MQKHKVAQEVMKKNVVIFILFVLTSFAALGYDVNQDTTVFGYQEEEYGPKPESFTFSLFSGFYFHGLDQNFPAFTSKSSSIWRYGARLGYAFTRNIEVAGHLAYTPTIDNGINLNVYDYGLNAIINITPNDFVVPYVTLGAGAIRFREPNIIDFTRFQINYGGGIKFFAFKNMSIAPEFIAITSFDSVHTAFSATLNLTYYLTTKSTNTDRDLDGVYDFVDQCPDVPGTVNNHGCPEDRDHDGVVDADDQCPDVAGSASNHGCPDVQDRDHDGVLDIDDQCPDIPGPASNHGCPPDRDRDGVLDAVDQCPDVPGPASNHGCPADSDHDGVLDTVDQCPNTPAGTKVDATGCPLVQDEDHDGVLDKDDKCPHTPAGTKVDATGCPLVQDEDHDGVLDKDDKCPHTPAGTKVDMYGCPLKPNDSDGDGIPDDIDKCPNQRETYNNYKDDDGCPDNELDEFSGVIEGIYFETSQALIKKESYPKLNKAAEVLGKYPILTFVIEGHTDSTGSKAYNMTLSEKRAQSVYEYLRYRGIGAERMSVKGYGPTKPIADNKTVKGRGRNRRIEFQILNLEQAKKQYDEIMKRAQ